MRVIKAEAERLIELAAEDNELGADLSALAQSILAAADDAQVKSTDVASVLLSGPMPTRGTEDSPPHSTSSDEADRSDVDRLAEPLRELTLGRSASANRVTPENRFWTTAYPNEVKLRLSKPLQERFRILKQGEKLVIEGR
jgi:hypothetical protein